MTKANLKKLKVRINETNDDTPKKVRRLVNTCGRESSEKMISRPHSSAPVPGALCCRDREHLFFALKSLKRAWWDWSEWHAALAQLETEVHGNLRAPSPEGKRLLPVAQLFYTQKRASETIREIHISEALTRGQKARSFNKIMSPNSLASR